MQQIQFRKRKRRKKKNKSVISRSGVNITWRHVTIISISTLIFTIIVIPTIIVIIPMNKTEINPSTEEKNIINNKDATNNFHVSIKRMKTGEIEKVPLETYVQSVVASEMPADFEVEALKAQAVAARTYIINHIIKNGSDEDDFITDTTKHQVYKNEAELKEIWKDDFHWKMEKIKNAVSATENEIITYEKSPITPTFFSMSNGYTENAEDYWGNELPYLKKVESKWEVNLPNFTEQNIFTVEEINERLKLNLPSNEMIPIKLTRTSSERVKEIKFNETIFSGRDVREKLGLRSNDFTVIQKNNHFIFTTKGYGHGVGMSQHGANEMAKEGFHYKDILHHYYNNIEINDVFETVPNLSLR